MEEIKKIKKERSLNMTKASAPMILASVGLSVALGGVLGRTNEYKPSTTEAIIEMVKIVDLSPTPKKPTKLVTTNHAIVPMTLMMGNCLAGSDICAIEMDEVSAMVGAKVRQ